MYLRYALLALLTIAAYWPAMSADFVYDDMHFVMNNDQVRHGPISVRYPRALTLLSYRLNFLATGENPFYFHIANLGIHLLNGCLILALAQSVFSLADWAAFFMAGLFLLHPLQSEAVIYISGRSELLATFFILLSVLLFAHEQYIFAGLAFVLSVASKEIGLVTPVLWWLYAEKEVIRSRRVIGCVAVGFLLAALGPLWHYGSVIWQNASLGTTYAVMALLSRTVWPSSFSIDHDFYGTPSWLAGTSGAVFIMVIVFGWIYRRTNAGFSVLWIAALTIPHILGEPRGYLAEHHMYAPFVGVALIAVSIFEACKNRDGSAIPALTDNRQPG